MSYSAYLSKSFKSTTLIYLDDIRRNVYLRVLWPWPMTFVRLSESHNLSPGSMAGTVG